jgi:AraC-like DNA-binding protein
MTTKSSADLPLAVVAERCGFRHAEYLTVVFTKRYGLPPSRWRALRKP